MPFLSKVFRSRDGSSAPPKAKTAPSANGYASAVSTKPKWEDAWAREQVQPEEIELLLFLCTREMKSRALDMPFLLLPFRPHSDLNGAKTFVRNFFKAQPGANAQLHRSGLDQELKLTEPMVLCSVMKWCWSRLNGGVVGWDAYELFKSGEQESNMAKHAFDTLIPLSVDSDARRRIIFDFFDLLAAIAANGKDNGLSGRKLSRLAGWWAFDLTDGGKEFDGGYKSWLSAADATSHLFFAYLRSIGPDSGSAASWSLPLSLQALLAQTEYPPNPSTISSSPTPKVVMIVDTVSPTPQALLRRAKHFEYRESDWALRQFSECDDPIQALTPECRRVIDCIATSNQSGSKQQDTGLHSPTDSSWSRFEDMGFSSLLDEPSSGTNGRLTQFSRSSVSDNSRNRVVDLGRPSTPSWADFMSSGFSNDSDRRDPGPLLLPPDKILPPLSPSRVHSSQSHAPKGLKYDNLEPGELASVAYFDIDDTFWWVWMSSLAEEETAARKAVFGRCAFLETLMTSSRYLIIEEQVKGAAPRLGEGAFVVEKKGKFFSLKSSRNRRQSFGRKSSVPPVSAQYQNTRSMTPTSRTTTIGSDQKAKVQAAAAALVQQQKDVELENEAEKRGRRRARTDEDAQQKTTSVLTMQPVIFKEAAPAMQWARKFDRETIRAQYLGDIDAGKGQFIQLTPSASSVQLAAADTQESKPVPPQKEDLLSRELPATPAAPVATENVAPGTVEDSPPARPPPPVPMEAEREIKPMAADHGEPKVTKHDATVNPAVAASVPGASVAGARIPTAGALATSSTADDEPDTSGVHEMIPRETAKTSTADDEPDTRDAHGMIPGAFPAETPAETPDLSEKRAPLEPSSEATEPAEALYAQPIVDTLMEPTGPSIRSLHDIDDRFVGHPTYQHPETLERPAAEERVDPPATEEKIIPPPPVVEEKIDPPAVQEKIEPPAVQEKKTEPVSPAVLAASAAAGAAATRAAAAASSDRNTASKPAPAPKPKGSVRGFRKLFAKKKADGAEVLVAQRAAMNGQAEADSKQESVDRKPSRLRKRQALPATHKALATEKRATPVTEPMATEELLEPERSDAVAYGEPGPVVSSEQKVDQGHIDDSPVMVQSYYPTASSEQFPDFSREPEDGDRTPIVEDRALGEPSEPVLQEENTIFASNRPILTHHDSEVATDGDASETPLTEPETPTERSLAPDHESEDNDGGSNLSFNLGHAPQPEPQPETEATAADRWAQIRKNAADRRASEEQKSQQSASAKTDRTDDGDTSGEETIDSRVARIKARVAELTGGATAVQRV